MGERDVHQQHQAPAAWSGNRNAMCDDRGRVQGLLDLYCIREDHFPGAGGRRCRWFQERYRMFLMLDDIEVDELAGEATLLSVQGPIGERTRVGRIADSEVERAHALDETTKVRGPP